MSLQVRDRVTIIDADGNPVAKGWIVNINELRQPNMKYAVDVDGYSEDVIFLGEDRLLKVRGDDFSE